MNPENVIVNISKTLVDKIASSIGSNKQEAIEDFVTIVLQNYLEDNSDDMRKLEDNAVEKRLKDLGYL